MSTNPYTLVFGKEPEQLLSRYPDNYSIIENFESNNSHQIFMLTGIRGSGKTVAMTSIAKHFKEADDWYVIDLSPDTDLIQSFAAELGEIKELRKFYQMESLSIALAGLKIDIKNVQPITDAKIAITRMLKIVDKHKKRVLITIDEVVNNTSIKVFSSIFQILLREELPVYLIMTGLYENINAIQNEKSLTFLYRAPKVEMKPINIGNIARSYKETFKMEDNEARAMAKLTNGYPFAFQVLGYLTWNAKGNYKSILNEYRQYLSDYAYEKIWLEMSDKDRKIAEGIASSKEGRTEEIKAILDLKQNELNPYRKRLLDKGIIESTTRGVMSFTLPFFKEFVIEQSEEW